MELAHASAAIDHPLGWLFLNILGEQMGLPIPAYPSLVVAGALSGERGVPMLVVVLVVAVLACLLADAFWYWLGSRFGDAMLRQKGRSSAPDRVFFRTQRLYQRVGPRIFVFAKFLPGAGAVATLLAGQQGTSRRQFMLYDSLGSALWAGSALILGATFDQTILQAMAHFQPSLLTVLLAGAALAIAVMGWTLARRQRTASTVASAEQPGNALSERVSPRDAESVIARSSAPRVRSEWRTSTASPQNVATATDPPCPPLALAC